MGHSINKLVNNSGKTVFPGTVDRAVLFDETRGKALNDLGVWREFNMDTMFPLPTFPEDVYTIEKAAKEFWKKYLATFQTKTTNGRLIFTNETGYNNYLDLSGIKLSFFDGTYTRIYQFNKTRRDISSGDVGLVGRLFKDPDSWFLVGGTKSSEILKKKLESVKDKIRQSSSGVVSEDKRFYVAGWNREVGNINSQSPTPDVTFGDKTFLENIWAFYLFDLSDQGNEWENKPLGKLKKNNLLRFEDDTYAPTVRVPQEWIEYTEKLKTKKIYRLSKKVPHPQITYNDIPMVDENSVYCREGEFDVAKYLSEYNHSSPMDLYWIEEEEGESTLTEALERSLVSGDTLFEIDINRSTPVYKDPTKRTRKYKTYKYVEYWKVTKPWETSETKYSIGLVNTKEIYVLDNAVGESGKIWSGIFLSPGEWDGIDYTPFKLPITAHSPSPVLEDGCCIFNPRTDLPIFGMGKEYLIPEMLKKDVPFDISFKKYSKKLDTLQNRPFLEITATRRNDWIQDIDTGRLGIYWGSGANLQGAVNETPNYRFEQLFPDTFLARTAYIITKELIEGTKALGDRYDMNRPEGKNINSYDSWINHGGTRVLKGLLNYRIQPQDGAGQSNLNSSGLDFKDPGFSMQGSFLTKTLDIDTDSIPIIHSYLGDRAFPPDSEYSDTSSTVLSSTISSLKYINDKYKIKKRLQKFLNFPKIFDLRWNLYSRRFNFIGSYGDDTYGDNSRGGHRFNDIYPELLEDVKKGKIIENFKDKAVKDVTTKSFEYLYTKFNTFNEDRNIETKSILNYIHQYDPALYVRLDELYENKTTIYKKHDRRLTQEREDYINKWVVDIYKVKLDDTNRYYLTTTICTKKDDIWNYGLNYPIAGNYYNITGIITDYVGSTNPPNNNFFRNSGLIDKRENKKITPTEPCMFSQMAASFASEFDIAPGDKFKFYCSGDYNELWYKNIAGRSILNEEDGLYCNLYVKCSRIPFSGHYIQSRERKEILGKANLYVQYSGSIKGDKLDLVNSDIVCTATRSISNFRDDYVKFANLALEGIDLVPTGDKQGLLDKHLLVSPRFKFIGSNRSTAWEWDNIQSDHIEQLMEVIFKYNVSGGLRLFSDTGLDYGVDMYYDPDYSEGVNKGIAKVYMQPVLDKIDYTRSNKSYIKNNYKYVGLSGIGRKGLSMNVSQRSSWNSLPTTSLDQTPTTSTGDCFEYKAPSDEVSNLGLSISHGEIGIPNRSTSINSSVNPRNVQSYYITPDTTKKTVLSTTCMKVSL